MARATLTSVVLAGLLAACAPTPPPAEVPGRPVVDTATPIEASPELVMRADDLRLGVLGRDPRALPRPRFWFARPPTTDLVVYTEKGALVVGPLEGPVQRIRLGGDEESWAFYGTPAADRALLGTDEGGIELWSLAGERLKRWAVPERRLVEGRAYDVAVVEGAFALRDDDGIVVRRASDGEELWRPEVPGALRSRTFWLRDAGEELWVQPYRQGLLRWRKGQGEPDVVVPGDEDRYLRGAGVAADGSRWAYVRPKGENRYGDGLELVLAEEAGVIARWELPRYTDVERITVVDDTVVLETDGRTQLHQVDGGWSLLPAKSLALEPLGPGPLLVSQGRGLTTCEPATGRCVDAPAHRDAVRAIDVVGDGRWIVTAGDDGRVLAWRLDGASATPTTVIETAGRPLVAAGGLGVAVQGVFVDGDGDDRGAKAAVVFHPWAEGGVGEERWRRRRGFSALRIDPDGWVVGVEADGDVALLDARTGGLATTVRLAPAAASPRDRRRLDVTTSSDGHWWWADGRLQRWSSTGGAAVDAALEAPGPDCVLSREGRGTCAVVSDVDEADPTLEVTTLGAERGARTWKHGLPEKLHVDAMAVGERVHAVALGSWDAPARLVLRAGGEVVDVEIDDSRVTAMALFAGERRLVTGLDDGSLVVWRVPFAPPQSSSR